MHVQFLWPHMVIMLMKLKVGLIVLGSSTVTTVLVDEANVLETLICEVRYRSNNVWQGCYTRYSWNLGWTELKTQCPQLLRL